ncbi:MAG: carbohydrate ABC transporter substrate-binding protein [Anaerolineaceae bacterium]|nr:carbohydrate ABC transporter substrate-binding protein [Anaerolineaceae bacterium]
MKNLYKIICLLIFTVMLVSACAPEAPTEPQVIKETVVVEKEVEVVKEVEKEVEKTVEVEVFVPAQTVLYNSYNGDPIPRAFDEKVVGMWNEAHPEMPVEHSIIAHEDFKQAIRAYLTADPSPDVLTWFAGNRTRFFIDKDLVMPLDDMWTAEGFDESYATGFQSLASYEDSKYFMPTSYYWWAVYYRPSLFEQAGIEKEPETWAEFLDAIDKLNAADITPITIGTRYRWTAAAWFDYLNMRINGPQFHIDLMDLKESYTDDRVKMVFTYWNELFEHDAFIDDPAAYTWQEALDPMIQGDAAMYLMGQFITDSYPDELEEDLDFFRFPIIDPAMPIGEDAPTDGLFIAANARNPEGAKQFMAWMGSAEVQQLAFDELGRLPTRTDVDITNATAPTQKGIALIQGADYIAQFYDRDTTPPMADAGMDGFMLFWDNPGQIDTILEDLEAERLLVLEEGQE